MERSAKAKAKAKAPSPFLPLCCISLRLYRGSELVRASQSLICSSRHAHGASQTSATTRRPTVAGDGEGILAVLRRQALAWRQTRDNEKENPPTQLKSVVCRPSLSIVMVQLSDR